MKNLATTFLVLFSLSSFGQINPIDVSNLSLKVGTMKTEDVYYGFAEGDQIVFGFEEINNKEIKEIEIFQQVSDGSINKVFSEYKVSNIKDVIINVTKKSVYLFRFKNSSVVNRIVKLNIKRIPKSSKYLNFNTSWEWAYVYDTTTYNYQEDSIIGYEKKFISKSKKELVKTDTIISELLSQTLRINSETSLTGNQYGYVNVNLPTNTHYPNNYNAYQTTEVISWAYWIGVGSNSLKEYEKINNSIKSLTSLTGYGAMANLALKGVSYFSNLGTDDVSYKFLYSRNGTTYSFDKSTNPVSQASGRNSTHLQGAFTIELFNDNFKDGIDVNVKIVCIQLKKIWEDRKYTDVVDTPIYTKVERTKVDVNKYMIRVNSK